MDICVGLSRTGTFTKSVLQRLKASMLRADRRWEALGAAAQLPVDLSGPGRLESALVRFENAMPPPGSNEMSDLLGDRTFEDLPFSMKLYMTAVLLHEVSLTERRRETAAGRSVGGDRHGERT